MVANIDEHGLALEVLQRRIAECIRCPRLVENREMLGRLKRRSYRDWTYWSRPVPSFGDSRARLAVIGLAPAAHGGNRTGRMFTGDASASFLMQALHEVGFANQPTSECKGDGLQLRDLYITTAARCVPPGDKLTRLELTNCGDYLIEELALLPELRIVLALGRVATDAYLRLVEKQSGEKIRIVFQHGGRYEMPAGTPVLYTSYHPSPRNHNTGRLTRASFLEVFEKITDELAMPRT
jgi:uracil-DNA glycosylase family 4